MTARRIPRLAVAALAAALTTSPARADPSASSLLQSVAQYLGAACNGDTCHSAEIAITELFPSPNRARFCSFHVQVHTLQSEGAISVGAMSGVSTQYRSETTWTYQDAITLLRGLGWTVANGQPTLTPPYPFSPFHDDQCQLSLNAGNGSLTVGSQAPGNPGVASISYDLTNRGGTLVGTVSTGGGAVVVISEDSETLPRIR